MVSYVETSKYCPNCEKPVLAKRKATNHVLHLLLTICIFGLWSIIWILSFIKFCGLRFEDDVPDHSVICRFRKVLTNKKADEELLNAVNQQLEKHSI